ncbi:hypothetical protein LINPERHAP2_LOCUS37298 [Linum perenne]
MLKILEICPSGQVFYILIPADASSRGWSSFLRSLQEFLAIKPLMPSVSPSRTFVEVVVGPSFPLASHCSNSFVDGKGLILVNDEGVKDCCDFLSKCLFMRFVGDLPLNWTDFRSWSTKAWGIPSNSSFHPLGDDLWLLVCSSVSEVARILALKRWRFRD